MTDAEIVERVRAGETALFEILMRRHNQRIYRAARAVIKDEADTEDVMQQAYINAFTHLSQFQDRSQFSTWLTRITVHEALARRRKWKPEETSEDVMETLTSPQPDPERQAYAAELRRVLEAAVDSLPETYRTSETAAGLELGDEAVKTRLHRARAMVRSAITERIGASTAEAFAFQAPRCDRVVAAVMAEIVQRVHVTS